MHVPYGKLDEYLKRGGLLTAMAARTGRGLILYCALGERSALALQAVREGGIENVRHLGGGLDAWVKANGPLELRVDKF